MAEACSAAGSARPKMYIRYEPLVVAKAGLEATLMHAGRSSQDIHATFQRAILRDETLKLLKAQAAVVTGALKARSRKRGYVDSLLHERCGGAALQYGARSSCARAGFSAGYGKVAGVLPASERMSDGSLRLKRYGMAVGSRRNVCLFGL